ncbi:ubiquitin carboxyl-terminal hydrolase [Limtongia smithiae]|uniref:ubiquitin carboxyl-terminal hydrolase n=1 Tax=Limtongia smithiae TaxID=1125753 RepID=UPI0034CF066F
MSSGWNTIESDAGVFTELVDSLGVHGVEFEDLLSLDPDSIRALSPVYGVVFLFKWTAAVAAEQQRAAATNAGPLDGMYDEDAENGVFFARQIIQNACATQAVLSLLLNRPDVQLGGELTDFKSFVDAFDPELRGEALSNSDSIRQTHNSFSRPTPFVDESLPSRGPRDDDDDENALYHFIAYVPVHGVLYELDGLQPYPIAHGACTDDTFPEAVVQVLLKRIGRYPESEVHFNLLAAVRDRRELLREAGDEEGLLREEEKRAEWRRENILRRENFVGLAFNALKGVLAQTATDDTAFEAMLDSARIKSQQRLLARR